MESRYSTLLFTFILVICSISLPNISFAGGGGGLPPTSNTLACDVTESFNVSGSGYVGADPTSGDTGCNPCCYAGSDLDNDGLQDVSFSVENSQWFSFCNSTGAPMTVDFIIDEPGSGGSCNLQGAIWTGTSMSTTTLDCGNAGYQQFGSNPGGGADGFTFTETLANGECAYIMVDGYAGTTCSGVNITADCPDPLPIELIQFAGTGQDRLVNLIWTTSSEINNDYFTIEYSINMVDWSFVDIVEGAGNSNILTDYSISHIAPTDVVYYRLKQTDYDGQIHIFEPISVKTNENSLLYSLYPNPVKDQLTIETDYNGFFTLEILNSMGQVLCSYNASGSKFFIDISRLEPGIYFISAYMNETRETAKFIK